VARRFVPYVSLVTILEFRGDGSRSISSSYRSCVPHVRRSFTSRAETVKTMSPKLGQTER
jgi:hypothetical protein